MSSKSYQAECIVCNKHFVAKKVRTRFCSNICRAQYSRDNRLKLIDSQAEVIKTQTKIISVMSLNPAGKPSRQRSLERALPIIREINEMVEAAQKVALAAGKTEDHWSRYVKDSDKFQRLCKMISGRE